MHMALRILLILFVLAPSANFALRAQQLLFDDFQGPNVTSQLNWQGNISDFQITTAKELQLNAPVAGASTLAYPYNFSDSLEFSGNFRMDFAPSLTNSLQIWIAASTSDLSAADGYYLEIGENGNLDALRLMRRQSGTATQIGAGLAAALALQPARARFSVRRTNPNKWDVKVDYTGGQALLPELSVLDNTIALSGQLYFGLYCVYTDTRKDKYFFDDLQVLRLQPDMQAPQAVSATILDANRVELFVNEPVILTNSIHATVTPGALTTPNVSIGASGQSYIATFPQPFVNGTNYTFCLFRASDLLGNIADTLKFTAQYLNFQAPAWQDVILNEIMPDPSPAVGLAEMEYVELYNRSNKFIKGSELTFKDGTSAAVSLSALTMLAPGDHIVLVGAGLGANLPAGTKFVEITGLPTLNNDGELLTLGTPIGAIIDAIDYKTSWYADAVKDDGGWSLERINPTLPCSSAANWSASTATAGGTPGKPNSILNTTPDQNAPTIQNVELVGNSRIKITFSEGIDSLTASDQSHYQIQPGASITAVRVQPQAGIVEIDLAAALSLSTLYRLIINGVADCSGNTMTSTTTGSFGLAEPAQRNDIVFNEILFNPSVGGGRFVELINRSNRFIDMGQCRITGGALDNISTQLIQTKTILLPDSILVLSANKLHTDTTYQSNHPVRVYQNSLPTWPDDEGVAILQCLNIGSWVTIDSFVYLDDWHNPFLSVSAREGKSLEKIGPDLPSVLRSSWTSAAQPFYGSPSANNSASYNPPAQGSASQLVTLGSNRISPDGDGYEDFLAITYQTDRPDYFGTVQVWDAEGHPIKSVLKGGLFGSEGLLRWDGDNDNGEIERPGIYLLFFEFVSPDGEVYRSKQAVTLVQKF